MLGRAFMHCWQSALAYEWTLAGFAVALYLLLKGENQAWVLNSTK